MATNTISPRSVGTFKRRVLKALVDRDMSVTDLAAEINRSRYATSATIHRAKFPHVAQLICDHLRLKNPLSNT